MRELISLTDEAQANRLGAFLAVEAIQTSAEEENGEWVIWVHDDDDREKAATIAEEFLENPDDPKYEQAERKVRNVLKEADRLQRERNKHTIRLRRRWDRSWWHCYPATYIMVAVSVLVALLCTNLREPKMGTLGPVLCNDADSVLLSKLFIQPPVSSLMLSGESVLKFHRPPPLSTESPSAVLTTLWYKTLFTHDAIWRTVKSGEVWRFVTPAFIHFGFLHILFNMMWLYNLGMTVEFIRGTGRFVLLCVVIAVTSNVAQLFWSGPAFGGMSGVVCG